jgi:hypothetical protein
MINVQGAKMIIATSQSNTFDSFVALQSLMQLLGYYRNIKDQVVANNELNALVTEECGPQPHKYRFGGARLEADANPTHPDSLTTGMRLTFLMKYDHADGFEHIQLLNVTADNTGEWRCELVVTD